MEVPAGQDGIQRLLQAEQEAQAIVAKARKAKTDRLKQAKNEAEREVAAYKAAREADFKLKIEEESSTSQDNLSKLTAEAERAVSAIQDSISTKKEKILSLLLNQVQSVDTASS